MAEILTRYLVECASTDFTYGTRDCATFCLGWADLITGKSAAPKWAGRYSDEVSCKAFIADGCGMASIASDFLWNEYGIVLAGSQDVGNIVLAKVGFGDVLAFGIRCDADKIVFRVHRGLFATRRADPAMEWGPLCRQS